MIATDLLRNLNATALINTVENRPGFGVLDKRAYTNLILILDPTIDINYILNTTLWSASTYFLVSSNSTNFERIFSTFWRSKVVNVFVYVEDNNGYISFYSFLPYAPINCSIGYPFIIDRCQSGEFETGNIVEINNKERIRNMNNCPINISMVDAAPHIIYEDECNCSGSKHVDGIEGKLITLFSKYMNYDASYYLPRDNGSWGYVLPKPIGAIGEIYTGRSEFALGMFAPLIERYNYLDFSNRYCPMECVTFGVPKGLGDKQKVWISFLISEFTDMVWFCTVSSFLIMIITFRIFAQFSTADRKFHNSSDVVLFVISIIIGVPVKSPKFEIFRMLFIFLVWFNLILTAAYQSSLASKLTVPAVNKDIETFEQLLASNLDLRGLKNVYTVMYYNRNETSLGKLSDRFTITNQSLESALEVMVHKRNIAYVRGKTSFEYYALLSEESKGAVNVLKDCVLVYFPTILAKKHSPIMYQLNKVISRLTTGGITDYWRSFYIYDVPPIPNPPLKLNLEKCKGIFMFLGGGIILSLSSFVCEVLHFRHFRKFDYYNDQVKFRKWAKRHSSNQ